MTTFLALPILATTLLLETTPALIEEFDATMPRTGFFTLAISPASLLGESAARIADTIVPVDEDLEWQVYMPRNYRPDSPPGVLVFVSTWNRGSMPLEWQPLMDEHNLAWISANASGAGVSVNERVLKALLAPRALDRDFSIDASRVYIGGYLDGGKIANLVQVSEPGVFKGGMYLCGAVFWGDTQPPKIEQVRGNRHVFVSGCSDPKERSVRRVYDEYRRSGVVNVELVLVGMSREPLPKAGIVAAAVRYLDGAVATEAETE